MPTKSFIADSKSRNAIAVLVWLSFVGMATTVLAQGPLPIPSGPSPVLLPGPPARLTVHPRPRQTLHEVVRRAVLRRPKVSPGAFSGRMPVAILFPSLDEAGRRATAKLLTRDEARRIAANIAKLPNFLKR
jgi:hypothetical protein